MNIQKTSSVNLAEPPVKPSAYIAEQILSLSDRLALPTAHRTEIIAFTDVAEANQRDFRVPIDEPIFKPLPAKVVLQNFVPFQTYEVLLSFRNVDKVKTLLTDIGCLYFHSCIMSLIDFLLCLL